MGLFLNSTGVISGEGNTVVEGKLLCKEPDYKEYISPMQLRRMSKAVRIGIGASRMCLMNAGIEKPDAISIGTAMGCLNDTEHFLGKMIEQEEQMLTPTSFIQSTHNTVSGQIALLLGCQGHNLTFVQRGHSFEHALINARLYLEEHPEDKILVGGIDEMTENSYKAFKAGAVYNKGIIAGEGAAFFIATSQPLTPNAVCVKDIYAFNAETMNDALKKVESFIDKNGIQNVDLILTGRNSDTSAFYDKAVALFNNAEEKQFKDQFGEYPTVSSMALSTVFDTNAKTTAIINHFKHYYACWLIERV